MTYTHINWDDLPVAVRLSGFCTAGVAEFHAILEVNNAFAKAQTQYGALEEAVQRLARLPELKGAALVWKRFFASDAVNQAAYLTASAGEAVSAVQQPPLNGAKVSAWLYFVEGAQLSTHPDGTTIMKRPHYTHLYHTRLHERSGRDTSGASPLLPLPYPIEQQTAAIFNRYSQSLSQYGCTLERNCIRTWLFVQDVDVQYAGMVTARREYFEREGLTAQTHYIASTGIEGRYIYPDVLTLMDAYAVAGIAPAQIRYLQARTHLNPTCEYGVTFERGTSVDYGDRRHIFISGTASINNRGEIVHPLDIEKQTARTFDNIQALLAEADASMNDVAHLMVYLRDTADYAVVDRYIGRHYPDIPRVIVLAPVCRPGWLVEVECMAIKRVENGGSEVF
jgi:enamine deaminase RidA (YjgF/YER057c/UK114 family)